MLSNSVFEEILDDIGSDSPAPGGGSVSALAAALSGSLVAMVANLTMGREKYREVEAEMSDVAKSSANLRQRAVELYEGDVAAFNQVMQAFRLPRGNEVEKGQRSKAIEEALDGAIRVPMELARISLRLLELCVIVASRGNPSAASDAGVSALMASAALEGAAMNVRINLASLRGDARGRREALSVELDTLEREGAILRGSALAAVNRNLQ